MHREHLLIKLRLHKPFDDAERLSLERIIDFVEKTPLCFDKNTLPGHITGAGWIFDRGFERVLLTHHRKLNKWLQLGGHSDGDADTLSVALREAGEESGLEGIIPMMDAIFDVDVHEVPGNPTHFHYDIRFLLHAPGSNDFQVSEESHDLAWVKLDEVERYNDEPNMKRMAEKASRFLIARRISPAPGQD